MKSLVVVKVSLVQHQLKWRGQLLIKGMARRQRVGMKDRVTETNHQCLHLIMFLPQSQYQYLLPFHLQLALLAVQREVNTLLTHQ